MHCIDREFSIFSILPPFKVVNAQVVTQDGSGKPVVMGANEFELRYTHTSDPAGSTNSADTGKTDFRQHPRHLAQCGCQNDNIAVAQLQGYAGSIIECTVRIENDEIITFTKNELVRCNRCHGLPDN